MARVWTIQLAKVWAALGSERFLYVDDHAEAHRGYFVPAYRWLQSQLASRLPAYSGHSPWWGYCWKPDIRRHWHLMEEGTENVRLELEIADERVLQFPCWAWQRVFCGDYLAFTREEYEDWTNALRRAVPDEDVWPLPEPWQSKLEASWQRLFAASLPLLDWDGTWPWPRIARRECVFELLRFDEVRRVTSFRGTLKRHVIRETRGDSGRIRESKRGRS